MRTDSLPRAGWKFIRKQLYCSERACRRWRLHLPRCL